MKRRIRILRICISIAFAIALYAAFHEIAMEKQHHKDYLLFALFLIFTAIAGIYLERQLQVLSTLSKLVRKLIPAEHKEHKEIRKLSVTAAEGLKEKLLLFTAAQARVQLERSVGKEYAGHQFETNCAFLPGTEGINQAPDWKGSIKKQFAFIIGKPGSGKSVELLNRLIFCCRQILDTQNGPEATLAGKKVPVYIDLKSLNRILDDEWIAEYVSKTASIAGKELKADELASLIHDREILYFFDGADEIPPAFRDASIKHIVALAGDTGITVSCRIQCFIELRHKDILNPQMMPAAYRVTSLRLAQVEEIIRDAAHYTPAQQAEAIDLLHRKKKFQLHLSRPILLNLFIRVFRTLSAEEKARLLNADEKETFFLLYRSLENVASRHKRLTGLDILRMRTYTAWLAKINHAGAFSVESIQPTWLWAVDKEGRSFPSRLAQKLYCTATRVLAAAIIGIAMGCIVATPFALLSNAVLGGLLIALLAGIYKTKLRSRESPLLNRSFQIAMLLLLILFCGAYQGISVPRMMSVSLTPWFSHLEAVAGILLAIALSAVFSYRILLETGDKYILPVESYHFDVGHALRYGFSWGIFGGAAIGAAGVLAYNLKHQNDGFVNHWLVPQVRRIAASFIHRPLSEQEVKIGIFLYGFVFMFIVSSLIIAALAGRFTDKPQDIRKKQRLNFGIRASFVQAAINAAIISGVTAVLYLLLVWKLDTVDAVHVVTLPLGMFVLAFLWFGGMEVINHIILRGSLYLRGIAPRDYEPWMKANENMGFIIPSGFQMRFFHETLGQYYLEYPLREEREVPRLRVRHSRADLAFYGGVLVLCACLLSWPIVNRYLLHAYSANPRSIVPVFAATDIAERRADTSFECLKSGPLRIAPSGHLNVGTYVGWVWANGTSHGYMGMPLDSAYNAQGTGKFRHAALLFRIRKASDADWRPYQYVSRKWLADTSLPVERGDHIQFLVNDKECDNNTGRYRVAMTFIPPEHTPKATHDEYATHDE